MKEIYFSEQRCNFLTDQKHLRRHTTLTPAQTQKAFLSTVSNYFRLFFNISLQILLGFLRKASGNKLSQTWKLKSVELRHGEFSYEDEATAWGETAKRKTISLIADRCRCRVLKLKAEAFGNQVFEVTEYGGIRRLWLASSIEERDAWIDAIGAAMIGSAGDFEGDDASVVFSPSPNKANTLLRIPKHSSSIVQLGKGIGGLKKNFDIESPLFMPYTEGIDTFNRMRESIYKCTDDNEYRQLLNSLTLSQNYLVVPVSFSKVIL